MDPDLMEALEDDVTMLDDDHCGGESGVSADQERRIRREIANSNERRRMQSINAGFQSLRTLLPHHEGEKLSKAAILQQTAEYIYTLEQEKTRLLQQNSQLKRLLALSQQRLEGDETSPQLKKKKIQPETETTQKPSDDVFLSGQVTDLNLQLIQEQRLRLGLEERLRSMEAQVGSTTATARLPGQTIEKQSQEEEPCRIVVTQELSSRPPATILLSAVPEQVNITEESPTVRVAVEQLPSLTAPPLPPAVIAAAPVPLSLTPTATVIERSLQQELTDSALSGRSYILTTTSRQNLDSIVEAIRHLEGDHLFSEDQHQVCKEEVVDFKTEKLQLTDQTGNIFIINHN